MQKLRKRIISTLLVSLTVINLFSMPVMAKNVSSENTYETMERTDVPPNAIYAGRVYRYDTPPLSLGRVTLIGNSKLHVYLPQNDNLDLMQGTVVFRSGLNVVRKNISNLGTDYWIFNADNVGSGIWSVTLVDAYAVGTTQRSDVFYTTTIN